MRRSADSGVMSSLPESVFEDPDLDRVRTSFVSSISHELRTPLTSILGYLELVQDDPDGLTDGQRTMLEVVDRNAKRLLSLIEDLLVVSGIESGRFKILREPVEVRELVKAVENAVSGAVVEASHRLTVAVADDVGALLGDRAELFKMLECLLSNAIKFTLPGGEIALAVDMTLAGTRIVVSDTGMGIDKDEMKSVFEPFVRAEVADRRAIPGAGLGLSIARSIVDQHGGTITCESEPGEGTRVTVVLPFAIRSAS